jgi:hypothetical protein
MTGIVNPWIYAPTPGGAWNPLDLSPAGQAVLALSAGNRVGTHVGGAGTGATVRGVTSHSSGGPYYFEVEGLVAHSDVNGVNVGVCNVAATLLDNWSLMGANDCLMANGSALISNPGSSVFASGVGFGGASQLVRVLFTPGGNFEIALGGGSFAAPVAFAHAGSWTPCMNLGYHFGGSQFGDSGSFRLATVAADFAYSVPGGAVEWG